MSKLHELAQVRHNGVKDICRWFEYSHLPEGLQPISKLFHDTAAELLESVTWDSAELTAALRKLLEAKDAAVRAKMLD